MANAFICGPIPATGVVISVPTARGPMTPSTAGSYGRQRLSTDAVGTMTLTLTNAVVGSRYRIERQGDGSLATPTTAAEGVAASSTVVITLDYYPAGSAANDLRIKVRKGTSAPLFKPYETLVTIGAADQSVYVAQIADE